MMHCVLSMRRTVTRSFAAVPFFATLVVVVALTLTPHSRADQPSAGTFFIIRSEDNMALDAWSEQARRDGCRVHLWTRDKNSSRQKWRFVKIH